MSTITQSEFEDLESLVDSHSLEFVVAALCDLCYGKAEHLRSNWQETEAAKAWERDAVKLGKVSIKLEN